MNVTTVRWVKSVDEIDPALWESCFAPPLEGRWWYAALERSGLEQQFEFHYGLLERDGRAIGIVPAFVMNVPIDLVAPKPIAVALRAAGRVLPRLRYQRTLFIGSPCSDEGSVGLIGGESLAGHVASIAWAIEWLARSLRASMLVWKDFIADDAKAIASALQAYRWFTLPSFPGTRIQLSLEQPPSFELYLKSLSGSHRHNLKKKLRKAENALPTLVEIIDQPSDNVLAEIFPLFLQTYEKGETKFEKLDLRFFEQIAAVPNAHFILLRDGNGKVVAFMLAFQLDGRAINKFIGIDYTRAEGDAFLYFQLWKAFVEWATMTGARELQSGQTGYRAKLDVGHSLVPLFNVCRHRNPLLNAIFKAATRSVRWATLDRDLANYMAAHPEADQSLLK